MYTKITVPVKESLEAILECAYKSLLSLDIAKDPNEASKYCKMTNYIDRSLLIASVPIKRKSSSAFSNMLACLIQLKKVDGNICELTLIHDKIAVANYPGEGDNIVLASDFFKVFSENYKNLDF